MGKTYQEKLLDRRWQVKKARIMERDGFKCVNPNCISDETATLHVHHLDYFWHDPWDIPDDMLVTLCDICHKYESDRQQLQKHLANTLRQKGFLVSDLLAMSCKIETDIDFTKKLLLTLREFQNA